MRLLAACEAVAAVGDGNHATQRHQKPTAPDPIHEGLVIEANDPRALAYRFSEHDLAFVASRNRRQAVGTPAEVDARLESLLAATGADELMLSAQSATLAGRIRSLEIVAALRADPAEPAAA